MNSKVQKINWDTPATRNTIQTFNLRIEALHKIYIPEHEVVENQKSYLLQVRKIDCLMVPQFLDRLKQMNLLSSQFPGFSAQKCFTSKEIKRIFYFAMTMNWWTNYIKSEQSLHITSIKTLKTYMVYQKQQTDARREKKEKESGKKQGQHRNSSHQSRNNTNTKKPSGNGSSGGQLQNKKKGKAPLK